MHQEDEAFDILSGFVNASWRSPLWDMVGFLLDCRTALQSKVPRSPLTFLMQKK